MRTGTKMSRSRACASQVPDALIQSVSPSLSDVFAAGSLSQQRIGADAGRKGA
jgi:hypothetical protein